MPRRKAESESAAAAVGRDGARKQQLQINAVLATVGGSSRSRHVLEEREGVVVGSIVQCPASTVVNLTKGWPVG